MIFKAIKKAVRETDILLLMICMALSAFGVIMVTCATKSDLAEGSIISRDAIVMLLAIALGLCACMVISFIDYDLILKLWPVVAGGCLLLMLLLIPFGVAPSGRDDATSWLKITSSLYFQPSEIVKIGFIITFAYHLSKVKHDLTSIKNVFFLCTHASIPVLLVILTGDMGSALIFMIMFVGMMFIAGVGWWYFPAGLAAVAAVSPVIWYKVFSNIQRNRILALFDHDAYSTEIYQQQQAANAIKNGGFFGMGLFKGTYTQSGMVPESQNDMVFSVVCEETGFVGAVILMLLFLALAIRIIYVGKKSNNYAAQIMCYGVAFMIISQAVINIGMCTMLLPVIGITLPFMSAGGSSTVCLYLSIGLIMSIYRSSKGIGYDDYRYARIAKNYDTF